MTTPIQKNHVLSSVSIEANTTSGSFPAEGLPLSVMGAQGFAAVEITITGDGTATIGQEYSSDGSTWFKPSTQAALGTEETIATGLVKTGGPDGDGKYFIQLENFKTNMRVRFYGKETVGSNSVTVDMTLILQ